MYETFRVAFSRFFIYTLPMKTSLENLKSLLHCAACNQRHDPVKAVLLEEASDRSMFHVTCASCGASTVVMVSANQLGVVSMGVLTDLASEEAKSFFGLEAFSGDQVLDARVALTTFRGGVKEFFSLTN
jgi:hypothetical protein